MKAEWFAGRMRELREQAGMTQKQLADRMETTVRNVSRLETGAQEATWPTVLTLCEVFGVGCDAFMSEPAATEPRGRGRPPAEADAGKATGDYGIVSEARSRPASEGKASDAKPRRRGRPRNGG